MNPLFTTPITTTADAEGFLFQLHDLGLSFHPENDAAEIINSKTGAALFTPDEANAINDRMEEVFFYMVDPCEYLLSLTHTDRS
jgi:hypothetical protein